MTKRRKSTPPGPSGILGLSLGGDDGVKRITTGEKFAVLGGSQEGHERLAETVIKTFEELKQRGKDIEEVGMKELTEIVRKSTPR